MRKDCVQLIKMIREIPEIDTIAMTTNGILLPEYLSELVQAGLNAVNHQLGYTAAAAIPSDYRL